MNWEGIYRAAIVGGIGGLVGWRLTESITIRHVSIYSTQAFVGSLIGCCVGLFILAADQVSTGSARRIIRRSLEGAVIGGVGGAVGLAFGEWVFQLVGGDYAARLAGWAVFGMAIGFSETLNGGSQAIKGIVGGVLGGAVGGALLELVSGVASAMAATAVGLVMLGGCVGLVTALILTWLAEARLDVVEGPWKGRTILLDQLLRKGKREVLVGSDASSKAQFNYVYVGSDENVAPRHAAIRLDGQRCVLEVLARSAPVELNGSPAMRGVLNDRDVIRLGPSQLHYRERRTRRPLRSAS